MFKLNKKINNKARFYYNQLKQDCKNASDVFYCYKTDATANEYIIKREQLAAVELMLVAAGLGTKESDN